MTGTEPAGAPKAKAAYGRSLADFAINDATTPNRLLPAEEMLVAAASRGEWCIVSDLDWTKENDLNKLKEVEYRVRAEVLRCLVLAADPAAPIHEKGIQLVGAYIADALDLEDAEVGRSMWIHRCYFDGGITLRNARTRTVSLGGCRIAGLVGEGADIIGAMFLRRGFKAEGGVRLLGIEIARHLDCNGASLQAEDGKPLSCDGARIAGSVFLSDGFNAKGEVRFLEAEIGGAFNCRGGTFQNKGGNALACDGAKIMGGVVLGGGAKFEGEVRFVGATIGGDLDCSGASFQNAAGIACSCDGVKTSGGVLLTEGFKAVGEVRLVGAMIGSNLVFAEATFKNEGGVALLCDGAIIKDSLYFRGGFKAEGIIDLASARTESLVDDDVAGGKDGGSPLILDGFAYERLTGGTPTDANTRAKWLQRQPRDHLARDFMPQPFEQLAKVLRAMGHDRDARAIGFLKEALFRPQRVARAGQFAKPFVWLQWGIYGLVAGYGYKPHRILWILLALWLGCAGFYWQAARHGFFAPSDPQVWTQQGLASCHPPGGNWTQCAEAKELPPFRPLLYSADVLIPIVDMGQRKHWEPMARAASLRLPHLPVLPMPNWVLAWLIAAENVLGALLVVLFGAIASGLVRRI